MSDDNDAFPNGFGHGSSTKLSKDDMVKRNNERKLKRKRWHREAHRKMRLFERQQRPQWNTPAQRSALRPGRSRQKKKITLPKDLSLFMGPPTDRRVEITWSLDTRIRECLRKLERVAKHPLTSDTDRTILNEQVTRVEALRRELGLPTTTKNHSRQTIIRDLNSICQRAKALEIPKVVLATTEQIRYLQNKTGLPLKECNDRLSNDRLAFEFLFKDGISPDHRLLHDTITAYFRDGVTEDLRQHIHELLRQMTEPDQGRLQRITLGADYRTVQRAEQSSPRITENQQKALDEIMKKRAETNQGSHPSNTSASNNSAFTLPESWRLLEL